MWFGHGGYKRMKEKVIFERVALSLLTRHAPVQYLRGKFIEQPLSRLRLLTSGPKEPGSPLRLLKNNGVPLEDTGTP